MRGKAARERTPGNHGRGRGRGQPVLLAGALLLLVAAGCASEGLAERPRAPRPLELTAVITRLDVDVEPSQVGTGPVVITVSNRDDRSHSVSLTGYRVREELGPINPLDTATLRKSLPDEGVYLVSAGSPEAVRTEIPPARIVVSRDRQSKRDDVRVR